MSPSSWLRSALPGLAPRPRTPRAGRDRRTRLELQRLDGRMLLSAGGLDPNFGTGGMVTSDLLGPGAEYGRGVAVWDSGTPDLSDDKIIAVGYARGAGNRSVFAVTRYKADGTPDASFGTGGMVTTSFGPGSSSGVSVALQSGGRVVVGGAYSTDAGSDFAVARYNANGTLDTSFGTDGRVITDLGSTNDSAYRVAVDSGDRIILVGSTQTPSRGQDFALARYTPNGSLDPSFGGGDGIVTTDFGSVDNVANGIAVAADGRIVVAGTTTGTMQTNYALARYLDDGRLDTSFDGDGFLVTPFGTGNYYFDFYGTPSGVALDLEGRIVLAANIDMADGGGVGTVLARYDTVGRPDASFGNGGTATTPGGVHAVVTDSLGRIVTAKPGGLVRFTDGGVVDQGFGSNGTAATTFNPLGMAIDPAGRIVLTGDANAISGSNANGTYNRSDFALARYTADGRKDSSFDLDGDALVNFPDRSADNYGQDVALQPDGKVIVAGYSQVADGSRIQLTRYTANGSLDTTFGVNGTVVTGLVGESASVAMWGDKILVAGGSFGVARFNANGSLDDGSASDTTPGDKFGNGGRVLLNSGTVYDVAVDSSGRVVLAGEKFIPISGSFSGYYDTMIVRCLPDGSLDPKFGTGGTVITAHSRYTDGARSVAIVGRAYESSYRIVVAGRIAGSRNNDFLLARYTENGALDKGFGSSGRVVTDFGGQDYVFGVALQGDGKIVLAGSSGGNFALARYTAAGALDKTFDGDGKVTTDFGGTDYAYGVAIQPDGKIVAAGTGKGQFALARYTPAGKLDDTFGNLGQVITDFGPGDDAARGVALRPTGEIVAVGHADLSATGYDIALAQYLGTSSALRAAGGEVNIQDTTIVLTQEQVQPLLAEALARWQSAGVDATRSGVQVVIEDLPGSILGLASGDTIYLDSNAAGWGWFLDPSPGDDSEFVTPGDQGERNRMDLLSVLAHEVGHLLGHDHDEGGVMAETLAPGVRQLPEDHSVGEVIRLAGASQTSRYGLVAMPDERILTEMATEILHARPKRWWSALRR